MKWNVFYKAFITNEGYIDVLIGLRNTIIIAVAGLVLGIIIGTLIAIVKVIPKENNIPLKILDKVGSVYVAFFRGTPIVVQLLIVYFLVMPAGVSGIIVGILVFGMNSGAYVSEIMRAGILSVDKGQTESGRSLGLNYRQTMIKIVLPQAFKNILPTLGNEFISLIKETSVLTFIAVVDLTKAFNSIASSNYEYTIPYLTLAAIYLVLVLGIAYLVKILERRMRRSDKR